MKFDFTNQLPSNFNDPDVWVGRVSTSPRFCCIHCHSFGISMADTKHPHNFLVVSQRKAGCGIISCRGP